LRVLEREKIPLHSIAGVSAGTIVGAAFASGATADEIGAAGCAMRLSDVASWGICKLGLARSDRMVAFLRRLLKHMRFEDMQIPFGVVATDLRSGEPVLFHTEGEVAPAIRASCSYPGLFRPVELNGRLLVDGAMSVEVPSLLARTLGATHVIAARIPNNDSDFKPHNMFDVVSRSFQIMMAHNEHTWRRYSNVVISPDVGTMAWDGFANAKKMIEAGEEAATEALPQIRDWIGTSRTVSLPVLVNPKLAEIA
jgi:NTE family protein